MVRPSSLRGRLPTREPWCASFGDGPFAIDPLLRAEHPDVAEAVQLGTAVAPPEEHRMLLAATSDLRIWVAGQRGGAVLRTRTRAKQWHIGASGLVLPGPEFLPIPRVAVAAPPFVALLAEGRDAPRLPYFDTGDWLTEVPGATRVVHAPLVVTRSFGDANGLTLISYEELAS